MNTPTPAEAREIMSRFNASHFGMPGREHARYSIPARHDHDDDLRMEEFIKWAEESFNVSVPKEVYDALVRIAYLPQNDKPWEMIESMKASAMRGLFAIPKLAGTYVDLESPEPIEEWVRKRLLGNHDVETTMSMFRRKLKERDEKNRVRVPQLEAVLQEWKNWWDEVGNGQKGAIYQRTVAALVAPLF